MSRWFAACGALVLFTSCVSHTDMHYSGGARPVATPHVSTRLLLVGDAGHSTADSPVLRALTQRASLAPAVTLVVYLGDNIYPCGLPAPESNAYPTAAAHLSAQIDAVRASGANAVFVPGNHDWDNSGAEGLEAIQRQAAFVSERSGNTFRMVPSGGEPGPVCEDFGDLRVVFLDTQWWLHEHEKPHAQDAKGEARILEKLGQCVSDTHGREVVVMAHHPLQTHGPHGGFATWQDHLFPLTRLVKWLYVPFPVLGSGYVLARALGVTNQDLAGAKNAHMVAQLAATLNAAEPLLFAAGHEHNLQVAKGVRGTAFHVVSGAGSELSDVGDGPDTLFAQAAPGFVELEITAGGRAVATVHSQTKAGDVRAVWRYVLN